MSLEEEFLEKVDRYRNIVHKICSLYEKDWHAREDLFQEIMIQLWKNFPRFRGESSFSTWLYRVAINTAISNYRSKKRRSIVSGTDAMTSVSELPEDDNKEKLEWLYHALRDLSEVERAIVILYLEERTYKEMEDVLGVSESGLRVKMVRLKEKLRSRLNAESYGTR